MTTSANPVVIIPTHKPEMSSYEEIALLQCQKILGNFPIYLVFPEGMNIGAYKKIFPKLLTLCVPPEWMASIAAYNKLMISPYIFKALKDYSHVLIHEPDAIILKDELVLWCQKGYDYVGASWFFKNEQTSTPSLKSTGNFGLSLINLQTVNNIFQENPRWITPTMILREVFRFFRGKSSLKKILAFIGKPGRVASASIFYKDYCDIFWSYLIPKIHRNFLKAPPEEAVLFSWETELKTCFQLCKGQIPFGIHAWHKYDYEFLEPILCKAGVNLEPSEGGY